jgi:hypothetical protein
MQQQMGDDHRAKGRAEPFVNGYAAEAGAIATRKARKIALSRSRLVLLRLGVASGCFMFLPFDTNANEGNCHLRLA